MKSPQEWPASSVEMRPLSGLTPYAKNSRTHSPEQVDQIAASMKEFGFTNPILVDETGTIIAGHGRVLAAQKLGILEAPVMIARGWTEAQRRAYVIADNKLALNAGWDMSKLTAELGDLKGFGFDLGLMGFSGQELAAMSATAIGRTDPDEVPEPWARAVTQAGDVWLLGGHRLVCGDSTDAGAVEACLGQEKPHLMVTDPPYGVEYAPDWRNKATRADGSKIGASALGKVENDGKADWRDAWALFPGDVAYIWHAGVHSGTVAESLQATDFQLRAQIVWRKNNFAIGRGDYHWQHEPAWYAVRKGAKGHWQGDRKQSTVWDIAKPAKSETGHGTQKPVECMKRPIENNSVAGNAVYEPFSGSGTTIIAAEQTARRCLAIELNPIYVDVAIRRWEAFTGRKATLQATGQTFEDVADARYDWRKDGLASWEEWCAAKRDEKKNARSEKAA